MKKHIFIMVLFIFLAFKAVDTKSEYNIPLSPYSIFISDIDMDGDNDIVFGHLYKYITEWSGITILSNDGNGLFQKDSSYLYGNHWDIFISKIDDNNSYDYITQSYFNENYAIAICFDIIQSTNNIQYVYLIYYPDFLAIGDINGDSFEDIVFANNINHKWGIVYNDGNGNFSSPEYYNISFPPIDIVSGDLNNDGRDDIIIGGKIEILFSEEDGFQSLPTEVIVNHLEIIDFDFDGDLDIVGAINLFPSAYHKLQIMENLGEEEFLIHEPVYFQPLCDFNFIATDFNNDSLPDLLFHPGDHKNLMIFYNMGDFTLSDAVYVPMADYGETARRSASADFDGNGYNDIVTIRGWGAPLPANVNIFFNDGKGNFIEDPLTAIENPNTNQETQIICYPNPFTEEITIEFNINKRMPVNISIFNISGQNIITLTNDNYLPGKYKVIWNAKDKNGKEVQSGLFIVRLQSGREIITKRVEFIR